MSAVKLQNAHRYKCMKPDQPVDIGQTSHCYKPTLPQTIPVAYAAHYRIAHRPIQPYFASILSTSLIEYCKHAKLKLLQGKSYETRTHENLPSVLNYCSISLCDYKYKNEGIEKRMRKSEFPDSKNTKVQIKISVYTVAIKSINFDS